MTHLVYTLRPNRDTLWLPNDLADLLRVKRGDTLTPAQFENRQVQDLIARRSGKTKPTPLE